jgi:hypothetical protein
VIYFSNILLPIIVRVKAGHTEGIMQNGVSYCFALKDLVAKQLAKEKKQTKYEYTFELENVYGDLSRYKGKRKEELEKRARDLSDLMVDRFEEMKHNSEIMHELNTVDDNDKTNDAIQELYPDMAFTISDVLRDASKYGSRALNSIEPPKKIKSKSVLRAYGQENSLQSLSKSIGDRKSSMMDRNNSKYILKRLINFL